jgi:SOS-response transcriptional repressor LexA
MKERLIKFLAHLGLGQDKFEKKVGLSRGFVNKVGDSMREVSIKKILAVYPDLNINWLKTGEGSMLKDDKAEAGKSVPLLPIEAVAGFPCEDVSGIVYADCDQYTVPEFEHSGYEFVIRVSGSSMYPKYSNGDILACKKIREILFFQWGKVYVIDSSQGALVKRVFEDMNNPDNILLVSENKEHYPPFSIPKSDIRSLSIVLGVIRME